MPVPLRRHKKSSGNIPIPEPDMNFSQTLQFNILPHWDAAQDGRGGRIEEEKEEKEEEEKGAESEGKKEVGNVAVMSRREDDDEDDKDMRTVLTHHSYQEEIEEAETYSENGEEQDGGEEQDQRVQNTLLYAAEQQGMGAERDDKDEDNAVDVSHNEGAEDAQENSNTQVSSNVFQFSATLPFRSSANHINALATPPQSLTSPSLNAGSHITYLHPPSSTYAANLTLPSSDVNSSLQDIPPLSDLVADPNVVISSIEEADGMFRVEINTIEETDGP